METVTELQEWIEANPGGDIEIDVETETISYDGNTVGVGIDDAMQEALTEGIWDTTALMYGNLRKVERTAASLPYVDHAD
jgi:3-isopropylmalate/(R)-2-methylmalate dehydratase small subunit